VRLVVSYLNDATVTKISPGGDIGRYLERRYFVAVESFHITQNAITVLVAGRGSNDRERRMVERERNRTGNRSGVGKVCRPT